MSESDSPDQLEKAKILGETAVVPWRELQKFYAAGQVVFVSEELDLVDVAYQFASDNKNNVEHWLEKGQIEVISDAQALVWYERDAMVWTVVVRPWLLVQLKAS